MPPQVVLPAVFVSMALDRSLAFVPKIELVYFVSMKMHVLANLVILLPFATPIQPMDQLFVNVLPVSKALTAALTLTNAKTTVRHVNMVAFV